MALRVIVADQVVEQVNMGNADVATVWRNLVDTHKAEIWVTAEAYNKATPADRRLLDDMGTHRPVQDSYWENAAGQPKAVMQQKVGERVVNGVVQKGGGTLPVDSRRAVALALYLSEEKRVTVEFMTADPETAAKFGKYYGKVVPEMARVRPVRGTRPDFAQARRLLRLYTLPITASGQVLRTEQESGTPPRVPSRGQTVGSGSGGKAGGQGATGAGKAGTTEGRGKEVDPIAEYGLGPVGARKGLKGAGALLALQGISFGVHWIYDEKQAQRLQDDWAKLKPRVEAELQKNPTTGVLILAWYSGDEPATDSVVDPLVTFDHLEPLYGYNRVEALANAPDKMYGRTFGANHFSRDVVFIEPKQPVDVKKLRTPFPAVALATFVPGKEQVMNVKWRGKSDFDDDGTKDLDGVAAGLAKFVVLKCPEEIPFYNGGTKHVAHPDLFWEYPAEMLAVPTPPPAYQRVPTVALDSGIRAYTGTSAAMVFPANAYTRAVLENQSRPTKDTLGQLVIYPNFEWVRWVEPENMRLLRNLEWEDVVQRASRSP